MGFNEPGIRSLPCRFKCAAYALMNFCACRSEDAISAPVYHFETAHISFLFLASSWLHSNSFVFLPSSFHIPSAPSSLSSSQRLPVRDNLTPSCPTTMFFFQFLNKDCPHFHPHRQRSNKEEETLTSTSRTVTPPMIAIAVT